MMCVVEVLPAGRWWQDDETNFQDSCFPSLSSFIIFIGAFCAWAVEDGVERVIVCSGDGEMLRYQDCNFLRLQVIPHLDFSFHEGCAVRVMRNRLHVGRNKALGVVRKASFDGGT